MRRIRCQILRKIVDEFEIVKVREQPEEVQELAAGTPWPSKDERPKRRLEVSKKYLGPWGEHVEVQLDDSELLDVREGREVSQTPGIKYRR